MYKIHTFNQGLMTNPIGFPRGKRVQEKRREISQRTVFHSQPWKRASQVPREWHCRKPPCYLRHPFLLSNTVRADSANWRATRELPGRNPGCWVCCLFSLREKNSGMPHLPLQKALKLLWNTKCSITLTRDQAENWNIDSYDTISFPERQNISYLPLA